MLLASGNCALGRTMEDGMIRKIHDVKSISAKRREELRFPAGAARLHPFSADDGKDGLCRSRQVLRNGRDIPLSHSGRPPDRPYRAEVLPDRFPARPGFVPESRIASRVPMPDPRSEYEVQFYPWIFLRCILKRPDSSHCRISVNISGRDAIFNRRIDRKRKSQKSPQETMENKFFSAIFAKKSFQCRI